MSFDRILIKTTFKLMEQCMPVKMLATHICIGRSQPAFGKKIGNRRGEYLVAYSTTCSAFLKISCVYSMRSIVDMVLPNLKQIGGKEFRLRHKKHAGSDDEMISGLQPFGIVKEHLPAVIGGSMTETDCRTWLEERIRSENDSGSTGVD